MDETFCAVSNGFVGCFTIPLLPLVYGLGGAEVGGRTVGVGVALP